ncbi:MAG: DUF3040 domain-containing protein [Acidimicrobiales bacterium]
MPLSEDEQRILSEIEANLYETDPALARDIADTTIYSVAVRHIKWSILGFVVGLVVLVGTLSMSFLVAFGGFVIMLVCSLNIVSNARKMGRAGMDHLTRSMRAAGLRDVLGNGGQRLRDRFKRDEQ